MWGRTLADGNWAVVFLNNSPETVDIQCGEDCIAMMGWNGYTYSVRDLWTHQGTHCFSLMDFRYWNLPRPFHVANGTTQRRCEYVQVFYCR